MKERKANLELLRILAMLMIISLHYLDKGGVLPDGPGELSGSGIAALLIEAFCVSAVNVYVLISAYFLSDREYDPKRPVKLWLQVMFYSAGIALVFIIRNLVQYGNALQGMDKYTLLHFIMPVTQEHYWFITAYILMVLIAPLMNKGLAAIPEKDLKKGILLLLLITSAVNTILPLKLPLDKMGYDALWFMVLYLTGAYLRLGKTEKGIGQNPGKEPEITKKKSGKATRYAGLYVLFSLLIFASVMMINVIYLKTGKLDGFFNRQYHYNSLLNLAASVSMFLCFEAIDIDGFKYKKHLITAASASLGVYLIHEHELLRYVWPRILGVREYFQGPFFIAHWLMSVIAVYAVCMVIDLIRQRIFRVFETTQILK